jgi:hypothetical protein
MAYCFFSGRANVLKAEEAHIIRMTKKAIPQSANKQQIPLILIMYTPCFSFFLTDD